MKFTLAALRKRIARSFLDYASSPQYDRKVIIRLHPFESRRDRKRLIRRVVIDPADRVWRSPIAGEFPN